MPFVIFTKPREERRAKKNLERQGFEVFLPLCAMGSLEPKPLFPRYLFVYPGEVHWGKIRNTFGVSYIVKNDNIPCEIQEGIIVEIKSRMNENGVIAMEPKPERTFETGRKLKITAGKFADLDGLFVKREKDRIIALISMMGRQMYVKVSEKNIA